MTSERLCSEETVLEFVDLIYDAAVEPAGWRRLLHALAARMQSPALGFVIHSLNGSAASAIEWIGSTDGQKSYESYYSRVNPWWSAPSQHLFRPGAVLPGRAVLSHRALKRTEFYADWGKENHVVHTLGTLLARSGSVFSYLSINRDGRSAEFSDDEIEFLRSLCPHLQRAVRIHERLSHARLTVDAFDRAPFGVAVVRGDLSVLLMNRAAIVITEDHDGIHYADNALVFSSEEAALLKAAVAQVMTKTWTNGKMQEAFQIARPSGKRPYSVLISPVSPTMPISLFEDARTVTLIITDPECEPQNVEAIVRALYGLTKAEARLSLKLAAGLSLDATAEQLHITRNTAKSQLKAIFGKTRTSRQGELVSLLLRSVPQ